MSDEPLKTAQDGVSLVTEIIKPAGDDPRVKEAAGNLGQTAVTLTRAINNALIPLAAINFAFDKARAYFSGRFQQDLAEKAAAIPEENMIEPKASVAGPTLQGLAFTHEEPNLKEMYLNLLATAMDSRVADVAHPAFVEIIKQLDSEDARLLQGVLRQATPIAIVEIRRKRIGEAGFHVVMRHLLDLKRMDSGVPVEDSRLPAMVDNWVRLGLVGVSYDTHLTALAAYSWVELRPEFVRLSNQQSLLEHKLEFQKGIMRRTEFGTQFAKAIGLQ